MAILLQFVRSDVVQLDASVAMPLEDSVIGHFNTIVTDHDTAQYARSCDRASMLSLVGLRIV